MLFVEKSPKLFMNTFLSRAIAVCVFWLPWPCPSRAVTTTPLLHPLFTNNMVLQRDASDPVWGWANPGTTITVTVLRPKQRRPPDEDRDRRFRRELEDHHRPFSLVAGNAAYHFTVATSGSSLTVSNVLIGDVWLCSGQSNMEYTL